MTGRAGLTVYRMTVVVEAPADEHDFGDLLKFVSDAAERWRPGQAAKVFVGAMISPAMLCPDVCPGVFVAPHWCVVSEVDGGR